MTPQRKAVALLNIGVQPRLVTAQLVRSGVAETDAREALLEAAGRVALNPYERAVTLLEAGMSAEQVHVRLAASIDDDSARIAVQAAWAHVHGIASHPALTPHKWPAEPIEAPRHLIGMVEYVLLRLVIAVRNLLFR